MKLQQEVDEASAAADRAKEEGKGEEAKELAEKAEVRSLSSFFSHSTGLLTPHMNT